MPDVPAITRQKAEARDRSLPLKVTGRLKNAIAYMVYEALPRREAAQKAGLTDHSLRSALRKRHVVEHLNEELAVLRTSARARNIARLEELRDQDRNIQGAVNAIRALEQLAEDAPPPAHLGRVPGITIQIVNAPAPAMPKPVLTIEGQND